MGTQATVTLRIHRRASPLFPKLECGGDGEKPLERLRSNALHGRTQGQTTAAEGATSVLPRGSGRAGCTGHSSRRQQREWCLSSAPAGAGEDRPQGLSPRSSVPPPPPPPRSGQAGCVHGCAQRPRRGAGGGLVCARWASWGPVPALPGAPAPPRRGRRRLSEDEDEDSHTVLLFARHRFTEQTLESAPRGRPGAALGTHVP